MAYSVTVAEPADHEVDNALSYILQTYCSPRSASRVLDGYESALSSLAANPLAYPIDLPVTEAVGVEVRKVLVTRSYKLLYWVDETARRVDVLSFLHTKQDAPARFMEDYREYLGANGNQ